jgi:hypothetical protein
LNAEFLFQFFDGDAERRLADEAGPGSAPEVMLACHGDNVAQFGQGHSGVAA